MSIETTLILLVFYRILSLNKTLLLHTDRYKSIMKVFFCPGYRGLKRSVLNATVLKAKKSKYSLLSISRTPIIRILRNSERVSELIIHLYSFLQPYFGVGDFFTSPNYPKCKLICTLGYLNL